MDHLGAVNLAQGTGIIFMTEHVDNTGPCGGINHKSALMVQKLYHIPMVVRSTSRDRLGELSWTS